MQMADFQKVNGGSGKRKWVHYVKRRDKVTGSRGCLKRSERWGTGGVVAQGLKGVEKQINGTGSEGDRKCARQGKEVSQQYIADTTKCTLTDEQKNI